MIFNSRRLKFVFSCILSLFTVFTFFRLIFIFLFLPTNTVKYTELIHAAWIGLRFDIRLASFILLPICLVLLIPIINPMKNHFLRKIVGYYLFLCIIISVSLYAFDFGNYSYLDTRLDISSFKLLENPIIALSMAWESYPLAWLLIAMSLFIFFIWRRIKHTLQFLDDAPKLYNFNQKAISFISAGLIFFFFMWGTLSQYRLLWSDAYISEDPFVVAVGLNPILYFNETRTFFYDDFNEEKTRSNYSLIVEELGIDDPNQETLSFQRNVESREVEKQPNIVIIFLESVGYNRMKMSGNPLNVTPNLDKLAEEGTFFNRFYVPMVGTARSIFGMITGIHDISRVETASSNPRIVDQYSLINSLTSYEKYYMMGGSSSWRNVRSLLKNNISDIKIIEQEHMNYPRLDVWGISDHDLFKEAHKRLNKIDEAQPFFAIIQTASNHRPYSIPKNIEGFNLTTLDDQALSNAGFDSKKQYNSMNLLDHAIGEYFDMAKKASYFKNTIFLLFGDHGTSDPQALHMPNSDYYLKLRSYRVPLIIYGPEMIEAEIVRNDISQLVDILPTVIGLTGKPYQNRTLGRDLLNGQISNNYLTFITNNKMAKPHTAVLGEKYYLSKAYNGRIKLHDITSDKPLVNIARKHPDITKEYLNRLNAIYETSKYMLYHNKK